MRSLMMSLSVAAQPVRDWMRDQAMHDVVMTSPVIPIESFCQSWHEMGSLTQEYIMMRVYCLSLVAVSEQARVLTWKLAGLTDITFAAVAQAVDAVLSWLDVIDGRGTMRRTYRRVTSTTARGIDLPRNRYARSAKNA